MVIFTSMLLQLLHFKVLTYYPHFYATLKMLTMRWSFISKTKIKSFSPLKSQ